MNHIPLSLQQAKAAARQGYDDEARRRLEAVLREDPTNDQALLWLVYLAEDGQDSLTYLARLLDAHPGHPQARTAIRWARRRVPTSIPAPPSAAPRPARGRHPPRREPSAQGLSRAPRYGLALLLPLVAAVTLWQVSRSADAPAPPESRIYESRPATPVPDAEPFAEIVQVSIPLFTPTSAPLPTPPPNSAWVPVLGQPQSRNLSCESRSVADLAGYWGVPVDELQFLADLGQSDNPHAGFVGDADQPPGSLPPYGYGVYAEPVAATLRDYGLDARPVYELGLEGIRAELLAGRPVMVWATYGMQPHQPSEWTSSDGQNSTVVPFMHTFLVTGFDQAGVYLLDAYDSTVQHYPFNVFLDVWNTFDQMAVVVNGPLP